MKNTMTLILGGGRGSRLYPLTRYRSKPAVPLGGKFRLVDVPISNALHAGLHRIFVLTQFNSVSLHRHISNTYTFSHLSSGFVDILAATQTPAPREDWYEGTADAVRKTLSHLEGYDIQRVLILSGDQLYRLNFEDVIAGHAECGAEVTIAGNLTAPSDAGALGIMKIEESGRVIDFVEKPESVEQISGFEVPSELYPEGSKPEDQPFAASMGIYVWELDALKEALDSHPDATDFGLEIIPAAINSRSVYSYIFDGYWEDIGTIGSFYNANLSLARPDPPFAFFHDGRAIYTHPRYLPAARVKEATIRDSILADGCDLEACTISDSVIGVRSILRKGVEIDTSVLMGADSYPAMRPGDTDLPPLGIGEGAIIRRAIIDKDARIGRNVRIEGREGAEDRHEEDYSIVDGIVVIAKKAVIPDGMEITA
ncbi:glucose-1-phosphate adenylyltransferase [Gemmatimonadota bacterium]